jgi:hypothetical protein
LNHAAAAASSKSMGPDPKNAEQRDEKGDSHGNQKV